MAKKLITLAKELDFKTEHEYFEYMIDSHINGQPTQCKSLFAAMKKEDKKDFLIYLRNYNNVGELKVIENFYFQLL